MKFKIRFADQIVGVFVLAAILAVAVVLILIGVNQRWFGKNYYFTSEFASGSGLFAGMPISLKGFDIGKISRMSLNDQNEVDVRFYVEDTYYNRVKPDSVLELTSSPIGLGTTLKFHSGKNNLPPVAEGAFIPSMDTDEGRQLVVDGKVDIPRDADVIGSVIAKLNPILDETRLTIVDIRRALNGQGGPLGTMVADLSRTPGRVNTALDEISGRINTVLDKVSVISDNVNAISVQTRGVIGDLSTNLDVISQNLKEMTGSLKNTQGLAKRLSALKNVNAITAQMKSFADFINGTRPQVTSILEQGSNTLSSARDVLEAAKNNPLLRGGVPARATQGAPMSSFRDENF